MSFLELFETYQRDFSGKPGIGWISPEAFELVYAQTIDISLYPRAAPKGSGTGSRFESQAQVLKPAAFRLLVIQWRQALLQRLRSEAG
jgi:hypothetical protein